MRVVQTKTFQRALRKVHPNEKKAIDRVVRKIMSAPDKGDAKKGDLSGAYTQKFSLHGTQFRLMYKYDDQAITLLRFGSREGFYLKNAVETTNPTNEHETRTTPLLFSMVF